ncbi:peptidylprolyl isomerase [Roseateles violae]|uniref:Chaperone SurA n=1 Tax=Roseateles violae TaxID=3058042 RepID=A0ABT8DP44_9BURK|nr:peptidylprolyl isomerase [Pelomonas sp. PFR6]MDN3918823.1 peptidylprolyl isomerase [Pelomonas sp. PFR6]
MTDLSTRFLSLTGAAVLAGLLTTTQALAQQAPQPAQTPRPAPIVASTPSQLQPGDYIAAVVNQDIVAASEVIQRTERLRQEARQRGGTMPAKDLLHKQALDSMIDERVLVTYARESGAKVDEAELDRVVANVAAQNKLTMPQLMERLKADGMDYKRFRENLRDQIMSERVREREVQGRIRITDGDIDKFLEQRKEALAAGGQLNLAQILVTVPENAPEAVVNERRERAQAALERVKAGEDFAKVNREVSEDGNKPTGGEIGLRPIDRLPDLFVEAVKGLSSGQLAPQLLRSGAGFHVLKVVERSGSSSLTTVTQTHARHVLLRPSAQLPMELAARRLAEMKRAIEAGRVSFEQVARENSEDGSAPEGGDLGWVSPGGFVPEFEEAMNALPLMGISQPVPSRFGVHLIQVLERRSAQIEMKQLREQARAALREQKYDEAYGEWVKDLRSRAFIEVREWLD